MADAFAFRLDQLQHICTHSPTARLTLVLHDLNGSLHIGDVTTPLRAAMFIAQLAHECGEFHFMEELADGSAYDVMVNPSLALRLGNTLPGDGPRFKGRGWIQLTGRTNYARAGKALGLDLEAHPDLAKWPQVASLTAAWFWATHGCNRFADTGDVEGCTKRINGGLNGLDHRIAYYRLALDVLIPRAVA